MNRRVVAIVPDLFFAAKIAATAEAAGVPLASREAAEAGDLDPADTRLVLLDLNAGEPALACARQLKSGESTRGIPIVGFYSHVDHATRDAARAAGVDEVLPRSAFVARLPEILRGD